MTKKALEHEYEILHSTVEDKKGLEAIRALHQQLDDDQDGTIEPSETGDFIKGDLKFDGDGRREKIFHKKDDEITVADLWQTWAKSEVYNWTAEQTADWLVYSVDLPQYVQVFLDKNVNGAKLPLAASDPVFLSKVLGISNSIHRSKISLKAMDVVLFGPPKEPTNWMKDIVLSGLLVALLTALFWAYKQKKRSEEHLSKMIKDMESLTNAEKILQDMQSKLVKGDVERSGGDYHHEEGGTGGGTTSDLEVDKLREEVEVLRNELHRAEVELEDRCWVAPTVLQHWLQLTYELESRVYNEKRRHAETQMEVAKDACEKIKRKRSSLVGAFVSTHGRSIDDVDKSILEAKTALLELTQDLTERSRRWRQIEMLTGVNIIANPGMATLQKIVRYVGGGTRPATRNNNGIAGRSSAVSVDDLHDDDARSTAASSYVSSHLSARHSSSFNAAAATRRATFEISRDSSKESSNSESDEQLEQPPAVKSHASQSSLSSEASRLSQPPLTLPAGRAASPPPPPSHHSPTSRRSTRQMVKSFSQDAPNDIVLGTKLSSSVSDSALQNFATYQPRVKGNPPTLDEIEESCSASDTGSMTDLEGKKKKKKSFFNFRRKKEKLEVSS